MEINFLFRFFRKWIKSSLQIRWTRTEHCMVLTEESEYIHIKKREERNMQLTWKPSFTISGWRIEFQATWDLSLGSQSMVLLNANPDIATWNLRSLLLSSLVCHPTTWFCLHTGPSSTTPSFLFSEITGTGHVPNLLIITRVCNKSTAWIICSNQFSVKNTEHYILLLQA